MIKYKYENVYEPEEDSKLLLEKTLDFISDDISNICEIGVGSGFVISNIAKKFPNKKYFGSDINPYAIKLTSEEFEKLNISIDLKQSNLLDGFDKEKFDLIVFNTPYFPFESNKENFDNLSLKDRAIYGGKHGYEVIIDLINQINNYIKNSSKVLLIFSSLTNLEYITKYLESSLFDYELVGKENSFFEKIYCLKFQRNKILQNLENNSITYIRYLNFGKHSRVFEGIYKNKKVIIKIGEAQYLQKEAFFEEKLKDEWFVPKMFFSETNYVVREKVEGVLIGEFFEKAKKAKIILILNRILDCCFRLDELKINKFEMTNPYKHIYVLGDLSIKFIDFERCTYNENPKNTTQVLMYFRRYINLFKKKGINLSEEKIFKVSKKYKSDWKKFTIEDLF